MTDKKFLYTIISPVCKYSKLQHVNGDWDEICTYHTEDNDSVLCKCENCKYADKILRLLNKSLEERK